MYRRKLSRQKTVPPPLSGDLNIHLTEKGFSNGSGEEGRAGQETQEAFVDHARCPNAFCCIFPANGFERNSLHELNITSVDLIMVASSGNFPGLGRGVCPVRVRNPPPARPVSRHRILHDRKISRKPNSLSIRIPFSLRVRSSLGLNTPLFCHRNVG